MTPPQLPFALDPTAAPQASDNSDYQQSRIREVAGVTAGDLTPTAVPASQESGLAGWRDVLAAYLAAAVDSEHTRRAYGRAITEALTALRVGSLADIRGADLAAYRAHTINQPVSPATAAQRLAALRSFLVWSRTMGAHRLSRDVIDVALRSPRASVRRPYQVLTEPEIRDLLAAADTARDRAIVSVMLGAGLRVAEVVDLDVTDLAEDADGEIVIHVGEGKGRKSRDVPVGADVGATLRDYLHETRRHFGSPGPLFRSHDRGAPRRGGSRLTVRAVGQLIERLAQRAGIQAKRISPHSLRHTFAIRCLRHGGNVVAVSKLLGHSSVATTQRYVDHLALSELRQVVPPLP